jgi:hypothetical protein
MRVMPDERTQALTIRYAILTFFVLLTALPSASPQRAAGNDNFDLVDAQGNIRKPADYRDRYQVLGAYTPVDLNNNTQMHYTYASPGAAEYYRKNGKFADGTVLVKQVSATDHAKMTTGDAHWATDTIVWFVMIKDDKGRYPGNPLWGDGWGWALYQAGAPNKQVATNYKKDCLGCHAPAQSTDWVYVQGYPVLKSK